VTLDQRSPERPATANAPSVSLSEAVADSTITVTGIVRSVLRRPWASGADVLAVLADGTGEVTVLFDSVGPVHLTAGVWVTARGLIRSTPTGWMMHEPELRAADLDPAPR
jgi:hypothetical protein